MRIGIFNEPHTTEFGGAEFTVAVLAKALSEFHDVEIIHQKSSMNIEQFEHFFGNSLAQIRLRKVTLKKAEDISLTNGWRRYVDEKNWAADVSRPYDLFINVTHAVPPFCHAPRGVLFVLFPFEAVPWMQSSSIVGTGVRHRIRASFHKWKWKQRMNSYQEKLAISDYSREWTKRNWGSGCRVVHPPTDTSFVREKKKNLILSVGRFTAHKKQLEMMSAFRELRQKHKVLPWEYYSVGGVSSEPEHIAYFETLLNAAKECGARVEASVERENLRSLFQQANIFWHARGYGEDESKHPWAAEHFGISTVEAMAAGCVPVVINKGGQKEIVDHGVNGFLWDTLEELQSYTLRLICDDNLRMTMSEAARRHAKSFSCEAFASSFLSHLQKKWPALRVA